MSLKHFRVVQEGLQRFVVEYVADHPLAAHEVERIQVHYREQLLAREIVIKRVPELPADPSGKIRKFISHVRKKEG